MRTEDADGRHLRYVRMCSADVSCPYGICRGKRQHPYSPWPFSKTLALLLKRRLFIFDRGVQPRRPDRNIFDVERMAKTLAHRAGDQVYIELRGPGNCHAELRWNYSSKSLLPKFPWEECEYHWSNGGKSRQKLELLPDSPSWS